MPFYRVFHRNIYYASYLLKLFRFERISWKISHSIHNIHGILYYPYYFGNVYNVFLVSHFNLSSLFCSYVCRIILFISCNVFIDFRTLLCDQNQKIYISTTFKQNFSTFKFKYFFKYNLKCVPFILYAGFSNERRKKQRVHMRS